MSPRPLDLSPVSWPLGHLDSFWLLYWNVAMSVKTLEIEFENGTVWKESSAEKGWLKISSLSIIIIIILLWFTSCRALPKNNELNGWGVQLSSWSSQPCGDFGHNLPEKDSKFLFYICIFIYWPASSQITSLTRIKNKLYKSLHFRINHRNTQLCTSEQTK